MGSVYLARERLLERLVAVKVLRSELVHGDARERFIREARTAARLTHPFIVPLYSFGQADDTLFYIMGFVEGESLEDRLRRSPRATPDEVRRLLIELADALDYAHGVGVVHRDIKPDNVLIDRVSGRAVLTDFGIAKVQAGGTQITRTGIIVGTPLYMSPEQAAGDSQVDGRSDLYSLGVIGYRMLTGRHPYEGDTIQEVFIKQVSQPPPPIDTADGDIPDELAVAVMRCLEREPSLRWPGAAAFRDALVAGDGHHDREICLCAAAMVARMVAAGIAPARRHLVEASARVASRANAQCRTGLCDPAGSSRACRRRRSSRGDRRWLRDCWSRCCRREEFSSSRWWRDC